MLQLLLLLLYIDYIMMMQSYYNIPAGIHITTFLLVLPGTLNSMP